MKKKGKLSLSIDKAERLRLRDCFDFLRSHEADLTYGQSEFIAGVRAQIREGRLLSQKQIDTLFRIRQALDKSGDELIVRQKY